MVFPHTGSHSLIIHRLMSMSLLTWEAASVVCMGERLQHDRLVSRRHIVLAHAQCDTDQSRCSSATAGAGSVDWPAAAYVGLDMVQRFPLKAHEKRKNVGIYRL